MAVFEYKGFDKGGIAVAGVIDADTPKVARTRLRRQGIFPTDVKEQSGEATRGSGLNMEIDLAQYFEFVTPRDIAQVTAQMSVLLGASVPMGETLAALVEQSEKQKIKVILSKVKERVNEGVPLADALADHPQAFDHLYVSMIRAGERTGSLPQVLARLSKFADSSVKLQGQVVSALAYPVLMSIVGVLMIMGIFMGVLPQVRSIFASFGGEEQLPLITKFVFFCGDSLLAYGWIVPPLFVGGIWFFRRWIKTTAGRERFDRFKLSMPLFGRMNRLVAVSRFCRTLGTLLVSGVPIISALSIVRDVVGNVIISDVIQKASVNIQEGQSIAAPLRDSEQFPPMVIHMIQVGERTGELERMLNLIADAYEEEVETTIKGVMSLLGPLTILAMGVVIGTVAVGLLLPMSNLSSMIRM